MSYGEYLRNHRILSGYKSQRRLAEKSGISSATISRIESEIQKPEASTLQVLSRYLNSTSFSELMQACGFEEMNERNIELKFGNYLKDLRLNRGLSLRELEKASGVTNTYISMMENGKRGIPSPDILRKIHIPLNVPYEVLLEQAGHIRQASAVDTVYDWETFGIEMEGKGISPDKLKALLKSIDNIYKN